MMTMHCYSIDQPIPMIASGIVAFAILAIPMLVAALTAAPINWPN